MTVVEKTHHSPGEWGDPLLQSGPLDGVGVVHEGEAKVGEEEALNGVPMGRPRVGDGDWVGSRRGHRVGA